MFCSADQHRQALYDQAIEYLEMGLSVIPISLATKKPLVKWEEFQTRLPHIEEWSGWATDFADYNIAVITGAISGIVILDMDNPEAQLYAFEQGISSPLAVKTKRGVHHYFKHPGIRVQNKVGGVGKDWSDVPGLDLRGDGGYALLPPSKNYTLMSEGSFEILLSEAPVWRGIGMPAQESASAEFSFAALDMSGIGRLGTAEDKAREFYEVSGKKMGDGDGRNALITQYAGEQVARGVIGDHLIQACRNFMDRWFSSPLEDRELLATVGSVVARDKREHPERWEAKKATEETLKSGDSAFIFYDDIDELLANAKAKRWLVDPLIAAGEVTHITAYSGHGKSLLTSAICTSLAAGKDFGCFGIETSCPILYIDAENPLRTIATRMRSMRHLGNPGKNLRIYSPTKPEAKPLNLSTQEDCLLLLEMIKAHNPAIVVLDTIRSLFIGLDENRAQAWSHVNHLIQYIKQLGCAVVLLHHRNKPGEHGMGGEAGSTAQLALIDTQLIITQVFREEEEARIRAGLHDSKAMMYLRRQEMTAWSGIADLNVHGHYINSVFKLSFGKTRSLDENQRPYYIGIGSDGHGNMAVVSQPSKKQSAKALWDAGTTITRISELIGVNPETVDEWINPPA